LQVLTSPMTKRNICQRGAPDLHRSGQGSEAHKYYATYAQQNRSYG